MRLHSDYCLEGNCGLVPAHHISDGQSPQFIEQSITGEGFVEGRVRPSDGFMDGMFYCKHCRFSSHFAGACFKGISM